MLNCLSISEKISSLLIQSWGIGLVPLQDMLPREASTPAVLPEGEKPNKV